MTAPSPKYVLRGRMSRGSVVQWYLIPLIYEFAWDEWHKSDNHTLTGLPPAPPWAKRVDLARLSFEQPLETPANV